MVKSTFHAHSSFDDGACALEDYVQAAVAKGFSVLGFSAHAPVLFQSDWNMNPSRFPEYVAAALALKEKYRELIEIYTGLEADYYKGCTDWRNKKGIDYTIGGMHFIQNPETGLYLTFDGNHQEFEHVLDDIYEGRITALVEGYYGLVREMLMKMTPNIVAHLDVIKKNNASGRYFDEKDEWYRDEVMKTLEVISLTHTIVEVNTGGMARGYTREPYPSRWILEECLAMDIPVMVNSDTHHPDTIDFYFDESYQLLREIGYKSQRILLHGEWQDVSL
jgi:histidinol-phosphatase (PHP family)